MARLTKAIDALMQTDALVSQADALGVDDRLLESAIRHADADPVRTLRDVRQMREACDRLEAYAVGRLRAGKHPKASWSVIGAALGMSKQAAWLRHPNP